MTSKIQAREATVSFPIMNSSHRSLKKLLLNATTGGRIGNDARNHILVTSLCNVSFDIQPGERVALTGHNGSGKTTLLRALAGVYAPVSGSLEVVGKVSSLLDISIGMDPEATGEENVFLRATLMGIPKFEIEKRFDEIAAFADLGNYLYVPVRTYSSGMLLRLAFAVSTAVKSDIILMDEWLSVGDENFSKKASIRLNELVEQAAILVIATHSQDLVGRLCNREIRLEHGSIVDDRQLLVVAESDEPGEVLA
jgi:lipopolysaccharide transport system ATP-binding protein